MLSLALVILAQTSAPEDFIRPPRLERVQRAGGRSGPNYAFFEFAPASGAGLPSAGNLCDQLSAAEKVGNWWCLNGDGTMASGSQLTLTASGSPTVQSQTVCPSGPNCGTVSSTRLNGSSQFYQTPQTATPSGDYSCVALIQTANLSTYPSQPLIARDTGSGAGRSFLFYLSSGQLVTYVFKSGASSTSVLGTSVTDGAVHVAAFSYDYVGDGTSALRQYIDGAASGTPSTTAVGPMQAQTNETRVGANESPVYFSGNVFGAFCTEAVLDATAMARIARAVLADAPTGAKGEALTFTRASTKFCDSAGIGTTGNAGSMLPNNRPCITSGGLLVESARTNSLARSAELDNAVWTTYNFGSGTLPVVTQNYAVAPDGTLTAERVQFSAVNAGDQSGILQASGITTGSNTVSVYVKGTSGSGSICVQAYRDASITYTTCSYNATTWTRCSHTATITATGQMRIGNDSATCGGGAMTAQDVLLWGAQWEAGSYATSYIPTTTAAANRLADYAYFTSTAAITGTSSMFASYTPSGFTGTQQCVLSQDTSGSDWLYLYIQNASVIYSVASTGGSQPQATSLVAGNTHRLGVRFDGTNRSTCADSACTSAALTTTYSVPPQRFTLGSVASLAPTTGIISRVCLDPNPERCR